MAIWFLRSRPAAWATGAKVLGDRCVSSSTTQGLGVHFEVTSAGSAGGSEPAWNYTVGGTTTDSGVTWTCRGGPPAPWVTGKAYGLGDTVLANSGASLDRKALLYECTTAGTSGGAEPTFSTTSGATTGDNTVTWTTRRANIDWARAHSNIDYVNGAGTSANKWAAGDSVFFSKTYSRTIAAAALVSLDAASSITAATTRFLCVDDTGEPASPTTLTTGAQIIVTGNFDLQILSCVYMYGVTLDVGTGGAFTYLIFGGGRQGGTRQTYEECDFINHTSGDISAGGISGSFRPVDEFEFIRCRQKWMNSATSLMGNVTTGGQVRVKFKGGNFASPADAAITHICRSHQGDGWIVEFDGFDFSYLGTTFNLFRQDSFAGDGEGGVDLTVVNSKLPASWTGKLLDVVNSASPGTRGRLINCSSGAVNYQQRLQTILGQSDEEATLVRTGGASDGTTPLSWKIVTTANARFPIHKFVTHEIVRWNDTTGSPITVTVDVLHDSATNLKDDEIWLEVQYLGSSASPVSSFVNDCKASVLATAADQAASSATWNTGAMGAANKQKLSVTFTPQMKGFLQATVHVAKASYTVYVDPLLQVT